MAATRSFGGDARPVVFLPGGIAPAAVRYGPLLRELPDVRAVLHDLAVYRDEAPPPGYHLGHELDALDRTADAAGLDRFDVYAHSGGAAVAIAYALTRPSRVRTLALDEPAHDFTAASVEEVRAVSRLVALPPPERMAAFMRAQVADGVALPPPPDGPPPPWMARRPAGVLALIAALETHPTLDAPLAVPTHYTWGSLTHPRWTAMRDRLAARCTDFTAERFDGLHHLRTSHQAEPARVAALLRAHWARAALGPGAPV